MEKTIRVNLIAKDKKFGVVVSRFNEFLSSKLVEGAVDTLKQHGVQENSIDIVWVPGSFEIPVIAQKIARSKKYDAVICLGTVIKGDTPHFDYIAQECARGIGSVARERNIPLLFGVLTTDTFDQAMERSGGSVGNKGWDAALSAITMANLYTQLNISSKRN